MKGSTKVAKGRIEEAAGALSDNNKLRDKGRKDQAVGHVKQAAEDCLRQVKRSVRGIMNNRAP